MKGPQPFDGRNSPMVIKLPSWSEKDLGIAEQYLKVEEMYDQNSGRQHHLAAHALGYKGGYAELPEGVRSAIKHLKDVRKRKNSLKVQRERMDGALKEWGKRGLKEWETDPEIVGPGTVEKILENIHSSTRTPQPPLRPKNGGRQY